MPYDHLSEEERTRIMFWKWAGWSASDIGRALGRSCSTITRELDRNRGAIHGTAKGYFGAEAHRLAACRRAKANGQRSKLDHGPVGDYVREKLAEYWSPQQIAGRLKLDYPEDSSMRVSAEGIYQWVYRRAAQGEDWQQYLRRGRGRRRVRSARKTQGEVKFAGKPIDQRPTQVQQRQRPGDWESDTVVGARSSRAALVTHVDRRSRLLSIRKVANRKARTVRRAIVRMLGTLPIDHRRTMTVDNGSEFAHWSRIEADLGLEVYFAQPYKAWQRGSNENANGLIRQFFPKGMDLSRVRPGEVARVEQLLNNRPRKCLNYRTPAEVFNNSPPLALRT